MHKDKVKDKIENLRGGLYIREYPAGQATVNTIHAHLEKCMQQNIKPDLIIIDYADLLTSKASKEKRDKLDDIYTNLRGLATEMKVPIWTASQVNRSGAREDIIQGDRMAESYTKMMITDFAMSLARNAEDKVSKAMHGTTRQLVFNAIEGVTSGFSKHLEIIGVGYNAKSQNNRVILQLGFSHDIIFDLPDGIEAIADGKKGDKLEIKGINKQIVGQVAAKIRSLRKPEPYKGKGIRYKDEYVRSKQGKTVGGGE